MKCRKCVRIGMKRQSAIREHTFLHSESVPLCKWQCTVSHPCPSGTQRICTCWLPFPRGEALLQSSGLSHRVWCVESSWSSDNLWAFPSLNREQHVWVPLRVLECGKVAQTQGAIEDTQGLSLPWEGLVLSTVVLQSLRTERKMKTLLLSS